VRVAVADLGQEGFRVPAAAQAADFVPEAGGAPFPISAAVEAILASHGLAFSTPGPAERGDAPAARRRSQARVPVLEVAEGQAPAVDSREPAAVVGPVRADYLAQAAAARRRVTWETS
jgi:hypothetical protein